MCRSLQGTFTYMMYNNPHTWWQVTEAISGYCSGNKCIRRIKSSSQNLHKHQSMENSQELKGLCGTTKVMPQSLLVWKLPQTLPPLGICHHCCHSLGLTSYSTWVFVSFPPDSKFQVGTSDWPSLCPSCWGGVVVRKDNTHFLHPSPLGVRCWVC